MEHPLRLGFGLTFPDLYTTEGLHKLDNAFCTWLADANPDCAANLLEARQTPPNGKEESLLILALAADLDSFIGELFDIAPEIAELEAGHKALAPLYYVRRMFVQKVAIRQYSHEEARKFNGTALRQALEKLFHKPYSDLRFAAHVHRWLEQPEQCGHQLEVAARYAAWAVSWQHSGILFRIPQKLDFANLIPAQPASTHARKGFSLTDHGASLEDVLGEANYCIWCHNQGKDSCSKGLTDKKTGTFARNPLELPLAGCPLEEKISEMNAAKAHGWPVGALAIACVDNPMLAATGHRICNDCMKACIYQKQEPVDIPQVETRTLKDVLGLPWGFEIYSLLTRWNPLNFRRPVPKNASGYKVLVAGLGPAGFTLAHHLLNEGHSVVGIDGLKIEPLPVALCGIDINGNRHPFKPIRHYSALEEDLNTRITGGFGGVAEYGITVRWNKNYLKVIRLLLERRAAFLGLGGVRLGSTLSIENAFALGFDHVALCLGAGKPTIPALPHNLAKGVRTASDFLMSLQLTGAGKPDSIANLQIRLPVVVIGGGLTAVDTATEALAYYAVQVEKFLQHHELLAAQGQQSPIHHSVEDKAIAEEFIRHAHALRAENAKARPDVLGLLQSWGGSTIAYRKPLQEAPCYRLNHEEVCKALEEGIHIRDNLTPLEISVDSHDAATALVCRHADGSTVTLPARTILIATGTQPNTVLASEAGNPLTIDGRYFQAIDADGATVIPQRTAKPDTAAVLTHKTADNRFISFFGDLHPSYAGNVVKAMASAKQGYPVISSVLAEKEPTTITADALIQQCNHLLRATIHSVTPLTPTIVEVTVHAPLAAQRFAPGQFYRLQNFESLAKRHRHQRLAMEGLALTGAKADKTNGLLSTIVLEMGGSSNLCRTLKAGDPVILMGPTGTPSAIPANSTVLLAGGGLGNAVLFSIGQALRAAGSKVLYFAGYKKLQDRYKVEEIEAAADAVVWCCDEDPGFMPRRPQDCGVVSNIVHALHDYATGRLGKQRIPLETVEHLLVIGSDGMMAAVAEATRSKLKPYLPRCHSHQGSINSPMQCMMKEICGQCLQRHVDPLTGAETIVFSCNNQDQDLHTVDFACLHSRLQQNRVQEQLQAALLKNS